MPIKVSIQRIVGTPSRMRSRMSVIFKCIFPVEYHICNIYTYIQKISYFHVFLGKDHLSFSVQRKNIIFPGKNTIFPNNIKKIIFKRDFFGKTIFSGDLKEISYFHLFFRETSSFIFRLRNKIIFSGKGNIIFPDNITRKIIF